MRTPRNCSSKSSRKRLRQRFRIRPRRQREAKRRRRAGSSKFLLEARSIDCASRSPLAMFSSRNLHFAVLGIILGASSGYVFAFYRAQSSQTPPALTETQAQSDMPAGHPGVDNEQMLAAMKKAVEADPTHPDVVKRYAMALFEASQFQESGKWFGKAVELDPKNVDTRSMYGAVLWRLGDRDGA